VGKKLKVLIVDDSPATRGLLQETIRHLGFETIEAENGEEGWIRYQQDKPDLTISDIYMPRMNGVQLLSNMRRHDKTAKIILITGYSRYRAMLETCAHAPNGFLQKPFGIKELARAIDAVTSDKETVWDSSDVKVSKQEASLAEVTAETVAPAKEPERDG